MFRIDSVSQELAPTRPEGVEPTLRAREVRAHDQSMNLAIIDS